MTFFPICTWYHKAIKKKCRLFETDAIILDELQSRAISLISKNSGTGVTLSYPEFPYLILWSSANHGNFVALEPWMGLSTCSDEDDVFEHKRNVQSVKKEKNVLTASPSPFWKADKYFEKTPVRRELPPGVFLCRHLEQTGLPTFFVWTFGTDRPPVYL